MSAGITGIVSASATTPETRGAALRGLCQDLGQPLIHQQCWCWGWDIRRPAGNLLIDRGFVRSPAPPRIRAWAAPRIGGPGLASAAFPIPDQATSRWPSIPLDSLTAPDAAARFVGVLDWAIDVITGGATASH